MTSGQAPMSKRRRLGGELREIREGQKRTLLDVASSLGWSHTKLSRLENGKVRPDVGEIMDLLDVLDITGQRYDNLVALTRQANARGWWLAYQGMPARQAGYAELESGAVSIRNYAMMFVPGLLQTEGYVRQRFSDRDAVKDFDLQAAVDGRLERQKILTKMDHYEAVIDEAVLRRRTSTPEVRREQLLHLADLAERPNITLRVLQFDAEVQYLMGSLVSFALFRFGIPDDDDLVSVETETSDFWLGEPEDLARYTLVYDRLRDASLSPEDTVEFLRLLADQG